jgi:hypothetical protein
MPIKRLNIPIRLNDLFKVIRFFNSREEELHVSYQDLKNQLQTDLTVTAGSSTLDGLSDVVITSVANGQVLVYDSATSQWINQTAGPATTLDGLSDVVISSVAGGQFLVYNSTSLQWQNTSVTIPTTLNSLSDVNTPSPVDGHVLTWDSSPGEWVSLAPVYSSTFAGLSDVNVSGVAADDTIRYDFPSGKWVPTNITPATSLNGLTDVTINTLTLANGQILIYNSTSQQWVNQSVSPGGVLSVTATLPITSTAGSTPVISTSMATNKLIGRGTAGTGPMEEITLGTNLSLSGTTLNATGGGGLLYGTASGTNTYAVTITGVTSYTDGDTYVIKFTNGNDDDSSININGLGAKILEKQANIRVTGGDIVSGQELIIIYDGTHFQTLGVAPNQLFAYVTNDDSVTINKGQPVYAFGAAGNRMSVKLANNTSDSTSAQTVGLVFSSSIAPNQKGFIITQGVVSGLNTAAYSPGAQLYLGSTAGALTSTKPHAPNHLVYIGIVERANAGNGQIYVKPQNGYELNELHDVDLITSLPTNNQVLSYQTGTPNLWKNKNVIDIAPASLKTGSCGVTFDGQGGTISNGKTAYVQVPYAGTITGWTLVANVAGNCTVTVFKNTYINYPPTSPANNIFVTQPALLGVNKLNATGLSVAVTAGDYIGFTISGVLTVSWVNLTLTINKT